MSPIQFSGVVLTGLATLLSANVAAAGCNCGVPPAPTASMSAWPAADMQHYQPHPMAGQYQSMSPGGYSGSAFGTGVSYHAAPGGYEARIGSPVYYHDPAGGQYQVSGDPHQDHYGPGFHRHSLHGHYRFPYYTYRAPWYYPGRAVYNRDTNFAW